MRTLPSLPPLASRVCPSGAVKALMARTAPVCPNSGVLICCPVAGSHRRTLRSSPIARYVPRPGAGKAATARTAPVCPMSDSTPLPGTSRSQISTNPSPLQTASSVCPSDPVNGASASTR